MEISPEMIISAYAQGFFPMAKSAESTEIEWICPEIRGVLPIADIHISRSLLKLLKKKPYKISVDTAFPEVIRACADVYKGREQTWINDVIMHGFEHMHALDTAHSVEVWDDDGNLVGGLYGLSLGGAFFGESMFSKADNASKIALIHLAARLYHGGYTLLDAQFPNEHLDQFGAYEVEHDDYMVTLEQALNTKARFYPSLSPDLDGSSSEEAPDSESLLSLFLQSRTQIS